MKNYNEIFDKSINDKKYYDNTDLRFNKQCGFMLSRQELNEYLSFKDSLVSNYKIDLNLTTFNSKSIYYCLSTELKNQIEDYFDLINTDLIEYDNLIFKRASDELLISQIASEIEGNLKIEGVNTTRRQIMQIIKTKDTKTENSKIILNMYNALLFIADKPKFNKENLKKLYEILSDGCLKDSDVLGEKYYRDDMVYIGDHTGCDVNLIEESMNSLFDFINSKSQIQYVELLKPFIAHYYILYIHPYFDYNGRTSRMVESWLFNNKEYKYAPRFVSEAINDFKTKYYEYIDKSRNSHNDLTYFLIFLLSLANKYYIANKNVDYVKEKIESTGEHISTNLLHYYKKILISNSEWFNWKLFHDFCNLDITKQATFKILNQMCNYNILITKNNSSGEKIYKLNDKLLKYDL